MCRIFFRIRSFLENGRKCFQFIVLCCVSKGGRNEIWFDCFKIYIFVVSDYFVILRRINDNEGVVEMLIDILGVSIVNIIDFKGRQEFNYVGNSFIFNRKKILLVQCGRIYRDLLLIKS